MLIVTVCLTTALAVLFAWLPGRAQGRRAVRADFFAGFAPVALVWLWFACICSKPGLTVGFDGFRCMALLAMSLWACGLVYGVRRRSRMQRGKTPAAVALLLAGVCGVEVFVCNLNWIATHGYTPVDLRPYLTDDADPDAPLVLDDAHTTLTFSGLEFEIYDLQLSGLQVQTESAYPEVKNTLFTFYVSATDEAASVSRQSWAWQVAAANARSQVRGTDFSGAVHTLTLDAQAYSGEYRQYPLAYTLETVYANVPRALDISAVRLAVLALLALAAFAVRPASVLWRESYLEHEKKYRPAAAAAALVLGVTVFLAPFGDRFNAGVATAFYNRPSWDGGSRLNFTLQLDEEVHDTAAQYGALAHSLLDGRLDLEIDPPEGLLSLENPYDTAARAENAPDALWDVAFYNGRYYVYFGLVPCLLFQLPFEALTGVRNLPPSLPMILMSWLYILAVFGALKQAMRRWLPRASAAAYLLCAVGAAGGSQLWYLLHRPSVYEYAILCGAAFVLLALWQWLLAANTPAEKHGRAAVHLALGSLCMALVAGCRPQMVLFAALALPILWPRWAAVRRQPGRGRAGEAAAFVLPVLAVAALLMWYNAARFGSPFDFGANYNLTSNDMTRRGFSVGRIAPAVLMFFFGVPSVNAVFPYIGAMRMQTNYIGMTITENYYGGAFACLPLLWAWALLPMARRRLQARRDLRGVLVITACMAAVLAVTDCQMAGMLYRYQSDWLGPLLLAAALVWLLAEQLLQQHVGQPMAAALQKAQRILLPLAVLAGLVYNGCVYFAAEPYMLGQNPALYQNAARLLQFWL